VSQAGIMSETSEENGTSTPSDDQIQAPIAVTVTELHPTEVQTDALIEIELDKNGAPNSAYAKGDEELYYDGDKGMLIHTKIEQEITKLITPPPVYDDE
jgi:hypothetical protein